MHTLKKNKLKKNKDKVPRSIWLLEMKGDTWVEHTEKKQFQFLSFHHDHRSKLLYVANTTLKI